MYRRLRIELNPANFAAASTPSLPRLLQPVGELNGIGTPFENSWLQGGRYYANAMVLLLGAVSMIFASLWQLFQKARSYLSEAGGELPVWIAADLPRSEAEALRPFYNSDPLGKGELVTLATSHAKDLRKSELGRRPVDGHLAEAIASGLCKLLADYDTYDSEHRRAVSAAVRYFAHEDDAVADTASLQGLDDDARVLNVVAGSLNREDVRVQLPPRAT